MERLRVDVDTAMRATASFASVMELPYSEVVRDAAIKRFEYSFEATWKALRRHLLVSEGMAPASPKSTIRQAARTGLLSVDEARSALAMVDDRNLTVHTYHEDLATDIFARLPSHLVTLQTVLDRIVSGRNDRPT